jgi:hypothetical protein
MKEIPGLLDVCIGTEIILQMKKEGPLDMEKVAAVLKTHKVKMKGKPKSDKSLIL